MPYTEVMHKWKTGKLHSGSKSGPKVKSQKQAVAIMLSEKRSSKPEYHGKGTGTVTRARNTKGILGAPASVTGGPGPAGAAGK